MNDPQRFNGKPVEIRSEFVSRFQWEGFVDETCSAKIQISAYGVFDDIRAQDGTTHLPVDPKRDHTYRTFRKYADAKSKWPDGGRCQDCPLYRILVTAEGRFDYFAGQAVGDLPLLRVALQSVSDVVATPIDPSVYAAKKARDVTLEEAHGLVKAFLKDRAVGDYVLDQYEVREYPRIQFFQALPDPSNGEIHYAVDRKTGAVWSATSCENLTSPSLKKLQDAIRNRIGITTDEFLKARLGGSMCDQ